LPLSTNQWPCSFSKPKSPKVPKSQEIVTRFAHVAAGA
jgi:hypothetical protein